MRFRTSSALIMKGWVILGLKGNTRYYPINIRLNENYCIGDSNYCI